MGKYQRVPLIMEAVQNNTGDSIPLETEHGLVFAHNTDWIITGCFGEKYPCSNTVFEHIYRPCGVMRD